MKRLLAILLILAMLLSLAACGGSAEEDPNAGKYIGISAAVGGFSMPMSDIYPGETWIELKSGGKGTITLDGDDFKIKWSLEGEEFTLTVQGVDSVGTLSGGDIVIDLMDMGCVMTFEKEGGSITDKLGDMAAPAITYNDAGYWDLIRIDGATEEDTVSEEDLTMLRELGMYMYLELLPDGTGVLFIDEEMPVTWQDGTVNFTEDNMSISYTLEDDILTLDMLESVLVFRKGEKPEPVVSEMEQAGFTDFMEVGVPYAYFTSCGSDSEYTTIAEATVTSYEIFESAEGYDAEEGYEWRVAKIEVRFYDENAMKYGRRYSPRTEDYYNVKLLDDTYELLEQADGENRSKNRIIFNGQETDAYEWYSSYWTDGPNGNGERMAVLQWDFLVPVGYDGCVIGLCDADVEITDGTYITDYDPSNFLLFRLD